MLKEYGQTGKTQPRRRRKPEEPSKAETPGRSRDRRGRDTKRRKEKKERKEDRVPKDPAGTEALRKKLQELREREKGGTGKKTEKSKKAGREEPEEREEAESVDSSASRSSFCSGNTEAGYRDSLGSRPGNVGLDRWRRTGEKQTSSFDNQLEEESQKDKRRCRGSVAGVGRAKEQGSGTRKTEEERKEARKQEEKGKGVGERLQKEEEEGTEKEEEEKEEEKRRRRRIVESAIRERRKRLGIDQLAEFIEFEPVGPTSEEVEAGPWRSTETAPEACEATYGSGCSGGHHRGFRDLGGSSHDELLQSAPEALLLVSQSGHERTFLAGDSHRRAEAGSPRCAGRFPCEPIHSDSDGHGGRQLEECPVSGDAPSGEQHSGPDAFVTPSSETCQGGRSEFESRRGTEKRRLEVSRPTKQLAARRQGQRKRRKEQGRRQTEGQRKRKKFMGLRMSRRRLELLGQPHLRTGVVEKQKGCEGDRQEERGSKEGLEMRGEYKRGEEAPPLGRSWADLSWVAEASCNLGRIGVIMAWLIIQGGPLVKAVSERNIPALVAVLGGVAGDGAVQRPLKKEVFPFPLGDLGLLVKTLRASSQEKVLDEVFVQSWAETAWLYVSLRVFNSLHGVRAIPEGSWKKTQRMAVVSLQGTIKRALAGHREDVLRTADVVQKELSSRFLGYNGEEVPKMEVLSLEQVEPALPPSTHGGSIRAVDWVDGRTKSFLLNPETCLLRDEEIDRSVKLQAKVHVIEEDKRRLALLLCERGVCGWTKKQEVLRARGQMVLNGLFGVSKGIFLDNQKPILRLIMNLIPVNSVTCQLRGLVSELPNVTQYLGICLNEEETLDLGQSDMTSAFYLFALPSEWQRMLCFNLCFSGDQIGLEEGETYFLSCRVLPMGWASAVGVMQELATNLLVRSQLEVEKQITRVKSLPRWLTDAMGSAQFEEKGWWHIYLDNFFTGQKVTRSSVGYDTQRLHAEAEKAWAEYGVLSSKKKKVEGASQELGAALSGSEQTLGPSAERLVRLIQTTLVVLSSTFLNRKWVQVVAGRWVHVLQFRRCGMTCLHETWRFISGKGGKRCEIKTRQELFGLILGSACLHTYLGAKVSEVTTASDASTRGGAVGMADTLSEEGKDVCGALRSSLGPTEVPVLVVSLFNGIGGAFRAYDLLGFQAKGLISYDIHGPANRVVSRRWPQAKIGRDVKDITEAEVRKWLYEFPHVKEVHIWGGFPCVDLSAVKYRRKNLRGDQSSLLFELIRVIQLVRRIFGFSIKVVFFVENVSSMDKSACREITGLLGVKPYRVQSSDAVPVSRPRFCWTNTIIRDLEGVIVTEKEDYWQIDMVAEYPRDDQWLQEGYTWFREPGTVLPCCMKAIRRSSPPPRPAGIDRANQGDIARWRAEDMKFPPYQFKLEYLVWKDDRWRLTNASERELLAGYGYGHTELCKSASDIKRDEKAYEDERCSLVGDSFNLYSFVVFAWGALKQHVGDISYSHLVERMGLAPGFSCHISCTAPLARKLNYGHGVGLPMTSSDLTKCFLARANHTGSDVRVTTGMIMNPKAFPRQSVSAQWYSWKGVFSCRWSSKEQINALEMRAILLALKWRVTHLREVDVRFSHLTDSYVSMSIISKGRSSSNTLRFILRKISAWMLAFNLLPLLLHVESTENPTDAASRQ